MLVIFMMTSCTFADTGKVVFYTDAQAMVNCGPFIVDIYIGDDLEGSISEPYVEESIPDCINSTLTVVLEKETGVYNYTAIAECGQYGMWSGEINILPNTCSVVFLDINDWSPKED